MPIKGGSGGGGGKAGDVRAGGAFYEVYAKDGLSGVLNQLKQKTERFAAGMRKIGGNLLGGGLAIGATPFASLIQGIDRLAAIEDLTDMFGLSAEEASRMAYAFEVAGVPIADLENVFVQLAKAGRSLDLSALAEELQSLPDNEKQIRAFELLGKAGKNFLRVMGDLKRLNAEAPIFSEEDIKNAEKVKQEWAKIGIAFKGALVPMLQYLAPVVKLLAEFAKQNAGLLAVVGGVSIALITMGGAVTVLGIALGGVVTLLGLVFTPLGLIATAAITLGVIFRKDLAEGLREVGQTFSETWGGIADAVKSGDLKLAFEILSAGIKVTWFQMLDAMGKAFGEWVARNKDYIVALGALMGGVAGARGGAMVGRLFGPWGAAAGTIIGGVGGGVGGGLGADALAEWMKGIGEGKLGGRIEEEQARLRELLNRARAPAQDPEAERNRRALANAVEATKGGILGSSNALQRFGYGDQVKKQTDLLEGIMNGRGAMPGKIGEAVGKQLQMK